MNALSHYYTRCCAVRPRYWLSTATGRINASASRCETRNSNSPKRKGWKASSPSGRPIGSRSKPVFNRSLWSVASPLQEEAGSISAPCYSAPPQSVNSGTRLRRQRFYRKGMKEAVDRMKPLLVHKCPFVNPPNIKEKIQWCRQS
jgi:hypothetical protein